jgi:GT2 family glycosyltransferase
MDMLLSPVQILENETVSASLVLYNNNPNMVAEVLKCIRDTPLKINLYIVDNSPSSKLASVFDNVDVVYIHNGNNIGFGKAHNLAISKCMDSDYHIVLNPDVYFGSNVIPELINYLEKNKDIGLVQPKICFNDGKIQYLCKQNPTFFALFARRFIPSPLQFLSKSYMDWYEMRASGYDKIIDVPYLSGCFMIFRRKYLDEIGYFDENIFMYLEDADITVRIAKKYRAVFYPYVHIFHHWARGSHRSFRLTLINIQSALYYFNKHGWKLF